MNRTGFDQDLSELVGFRGFKMLDKRRRKTSNIKANYWLHECIAGWGCVSLCCSGIAAPKGAWLKRTRKGDRHLDH